MHDDQVIFGADVSSGAIVVRLNDDEVAALADVLGRALPRAWREDTEMGRSLASAARKLDSILRDNTWAVDLVAVDHQIFERREA